MPIPRIRADYRTCIALGCNPHGERPASWMAQQSYTLPEGPRQRLGSIPPVSASALAGVSLRGPMLPAPTPVPEPR